MVIFSNPALEPTANVYHEYSHQMEATGGDAPYRWEFDNDYIMTETTTAIPLATTALSGTLINLPFDFPYYGETFNHFYLTNTGLIDFSGETFTLPYNNNNELSTFSVQFMHRKSIAAFYSTTTCSTFYSAGSDYYIIRWTGTNIDVSLKLESNGNITIYYNNCTPLNNQVWSSGVSYGNLSDFLVTPYSGATTTISSIGYTFTQMFAPEIFTLSESGMLSGTPTEELLAYPLNFKVTDAKGIVDRKTIPISTDGLIIGYDITTPNNLDIEWGETVNMNLDLRNATAGTINNLVLTLTCNNPDVTITDGIQNVGTLNSLQEIEYASAFVFGPNFNFYNEQEITLHLTAEATENTWEFDIVYPVYTADIEIEENFVDDADNNRLDIGETSDVYYVFSNDGGSALTDITVTVTSTDPFLTINDNYDEPADLNPAGIGNAYFNFTAHADCLPGHVAILNFHVTGANDYEKDITGYISVGQILETWESNTFDTYNWSTGGTQPWFITTELPYEGTYCLKSGTITHEQNSSLEIELQVISPGTISFYRKVSSEANYDFLKFYVDGTEKGSWSGEVDWALESYSVAAGVRNFKWVYSKDVSVNTASDCAWIDFIEFPSIYDTDPILQIDQTEITKTMYPDETDSDTLHIANLGGGIIGYSVAIQSDAPWLRNLRNITGSTMTTDAVSFYAGDTVEWDFTALNTSPDSEYIKEITMVFPEGFVIDSLTDFYDQSEDTLLLDSGVPGNGGSFHWFGQQPDSWGVIHVNETATATVNGHINEDFEGHLKIYYTLHGEVYGAEPHNVSDSIIIQNFGPRIHWLTTETLSGNVGIGQQDDIVLDFSSWDLDPGTYTCNLKVFTTLDTVILPVTLTVLHPVNTNDYFGNNTLNIYPNPASGLVFIETDLDSYKVEIVNILGERVYSSLNQSRNSQLDIHNLKPGVYLINIYSDYLLNTKKLIVK